MPTPKKPKRAGRVMWASITTGDIRSGRYENRWDTHTPVLVLPLGDVRTIVEARAKAVFGDTSLWKWLPETTKKLYRENARATLLADGVPAKLLQT